RALRLLYRESQIIERGYLRARLAFGAGQRQALLQMVNRLLALPGVAGDDAADIVRLGQRLRVGSLLGQPQRLRRQGLRLLVPPGRVRRAAAVGVDVGPEARLVSRLQRGPVTAVGQRPFATPLVH